MKRTIAIITAIGIIGAITPVPANAGDKEWATAGKIMTGVVAGIALANLLAPEPAPVYTVSSTPVYVAPPQTTVVVPQTVTTVVTQQQVVVQTPAVVQTPVVVQPAPVVVQPVPAPVVVAPAVIPPPPVVVHHPPLVVYHPPVFSIGFHRFYGHSHFSYRVWW